MRLDDWFLVPEDRGNLFSTIDSRHARGEAWSEGNDVRFLIDGTTYFARLADAFAGLEAGDELRLTDWRSDGDELLYVDGPTIAEATASACARGVDVRGLLWRSHSDRLAFSAQQNRRFSSIVTRAGGQILLDERVRRGGSHHQKLVIFRHRAGRDGDVAFVGGIDLCHGRRDDSHHRGDRQMITLDERYGTTPAWHDVQLDVRGPAVGDLDATFRERWDDPTPLNHAGPARALFSRLAKRDRVVKPLPTPLDDPPASGGLAVQVLRTYPSRRPAYPFAPAGERSVARAFAKAIERARSLVYIEDQYFWSAEIATLLAGALRRHASLQVIVVVPRFPDKDGAVSGPPSRLAQERAMAIVRAAGGERVGFYSIENDLGSPVYVHAKVCVIDDVWATVGSDNLNRRSWTHDSELSCAIIDSVLDERRPRDPGGLGDGSRKFARDLRLALWAEHLGRAPDDEELVDIAQAGDLWRQTAAALALWRAGDASGPRPTGGVRVHDVEPVSGLTRLWAEFVYRVVFDPDGRPFALRIRNRF